MNELANKAKRIAEIIDRNLYRQDEKVEDARALALELAAALSHVQAPAEANQTLIDAILRACLGPNGEPTELYEAARAILTPPSREVETSNG